MRGITIPITEYDIDLFQQLLDDGESFEWVFNNTIVKFVKQEGEDLYHEYGDDEE